MQDFIFNGIAASKYGLRISSVNTYGGTERVVTEYQIPGSVPRIYTQDEKKAAPFIREYQVALIRSENIAEQMAAVKSWLMSDTEFHKLTDTYNPGTYRMARFTGSINTSWMGSARRSVMFTVSFSCQPQQYLNEGELWHKIDRNKGYVNITNPTNNPAFPLVKMKFDSNATVTRGIEILEGSGNIIAVKPDRFVDVKGKTIYIDTVTEEVWGEDGRNYNSAFNLTGNLSLYPGPEFNLVSAYPEQTPASVDADIEIQPRYWRW